MQSFERFKIDFDPRQLGPQYLGTAAELNEVKQSFAEPAPIPWTDGLAPVATPLPSTPASNTALPQADYLVVTWTQAEAMMLASLMTPGKALEDWYLYDHNFDSEFIGKITGDQAPSLEHSSRFYHMLGAYFLTQIGPSSVVCFKSNLHLATDGPALPLLDLWQQIIDEVRPKLVITTGTAGAIGSSIKLGDVVIGYSTRFDCTSEFKNSPFASAAYACTELSGLEGFITSDMLEANSSRLLPERAGVPTINYQDTDSRSPVIVTTDRFSFDNTDDTDKLQRLGQMCEMDDATLGLALKNNELTTQWLAIRNASDPQIDGRLTPEQQRQMAAQIYARYGYWTTVNSVIATWASIAARQSGPH